MSGHSDGGPAFPVPLIQSASGETMTPGSWIPNGDGMTLRDYFAAKALGPLIDSPATDKIPGGSGYEENNRILAGMAYDIADAMLAERAKRGAK